jgi:hypothetical protein
MMGMNGVGSAGMTPEMMAYYQQQQLLAANNGGTASVPRFAPTQFGQVPPEFKPEDTNSAFWTPTLVGAGVGTIGAGISGFQGYQQGVKTHLLEKAIAPKVEQLKADLTRQENIKLSKAYNESIGTISQNAIAEQLKNEGLSDELIKDFKGKSNKKIIETLRSNNINVNDDYSTYLNRLRKDAIATAQTNATLSKPTAVTVEEFGKTLDPNKLNIQAGVDVLDGHLQGKSVLNTAGKIDSKNLQEAEKAFVKSTLANADDALKSSSKWAGLKNGGGKAGVVLTTAAAIGTGIGLWNASQASSRNEDKATQLAALRQQEAGSAKPESMEQLLEQQYIAMDLADNGTLDGSAKKPQGFVLA